MADVLTSTRNHYSTKSESEAERILIDAFGNASTLQAIFKDTLLMKKTLLTAMFSLSLIATFSQTNSNKNVYIKLSGGQVSFGTGDFLGYSFSLDAAKNLIKKPSFALNKLLVGGELFFENGVKNPIVQNPTQEEFFSKTFQHVSNTVLWTKVSYYPFKKIISGFNIQVGPTVGYSYRSTEERASRSVNALGQSIRLSTLYFNNGFTYGYRVSTGIEINLTKNLLTGFRVDFSNNNAAEINTLAAIKIGVNL